METFLLENQSAIYTCIFFGTFAAVAIWENFVPRRKLKAFIRLRWQSNALVLCLNTLLLWLIYPGFGIGAALFASQADWGLLRIIELPYWLAFVVGILLLDLGHYAIHYSLHRVPFLWRLHRLHHTDQDFDLTTAVRFHPGEAVLEYGANLLIIVLVGPPVLAVALFAFVYVGTTFWVHGNIRMPGRLEQLLRLLLVTPDMHRTHHSQREEEANSNYGGLFSGWDRLFRNYVAEPRGGHEGMDIGVPGFVEQRHSQLGLMLANPAISAPTRASRASVNTVSVGGQDL